MSDAEKAIRAAKLTLGGLLEKRRAKAAVERAQGQIAPSKYLPEVPRQVHAYGGRANENSNVWWHGSPSGDLRGGTSGLHLGTKGAALDALRARIGVPADGSMWDGTKEYGRTLLAGKNTLNKMGKYLITGHNAYAPEGDYYPHEHPKGMPTVGNGVPVDPSWRPFLRPFKIVGPMTNSPNSPHGDSRANAMMKASLTKGNAKSGYYYTNDGEDSGSISAVVPNGSHIEPVDQDNKYASGGYVPRAVHAAGGYVPQAALPVGRLAIARPLQTAPQQGFAGGLSELASAAGNVSDLVTGKKPEEVQQSADPSSGTAYTGDTSGKAPSLSFGEGVSDDAQNAFNALAASWGQPLEVISAYRDPKRNEAVGGAKGSQHIHGNAFDINTANLSYEDRLKLADAAWEAGFRGFGFYDNNMHFDVGDQRAWGPNYHGDSIPDWARGWWDARMGYAAGGKVDDKRANFLAGNHHEVPPVVYHSTRGDFTGFRPMSHFGTQQAAHDRYNDKWHPAHLEMSRATHDVSIIPAHISLKNPLDVGRERDWQSNRDTIRQIADTMFKSGRIDQDYLKAAEGLYDLVDDPRWSNYPHAIEQRAADLLRGAGHDGVIYTNTIEDPGSRSFITLGPEQVKSAISAREFDPTNPDMTKADGGSVDGDDIPNWSGNPDFQKWFGASKAVDETGSPLVLYHGTNQNIDQFDPKRGGTATGENAGATKGFFFTDNKDVAQQYADRAGRTVIPNVVEHEREAQRLQREVARLESSAHRTGNWDAYERAVEAWEDHEAKARNASDDEGKNIVHAHLSLQNPKIVDFGGGRLSMDRDLDSMIEEAKADGHDGMILKNLEDSPQMGIVSNHYVAFAPHQIKSVHNSGRFDRKDPRIHRAEGGPITERSPMFEGMHEDLRDSAGQPIGLYHGTPSQPFEAFDDSKLGSRDAGFYGRGHYLTPDKAVAEEYAYDEEGEPGSVMGPMHAALKNPYVWDVSDDEKSHRTLKDLHSMGLMRDRSELRSWDNLQQHEINRFMDHMKQRGHDGVIMKGYYGPQEIVVFNPNMIKHRDAEVGDPNDPRIMRASGGSAYDAAMNIIRRSK